MNNIDTNSLGYAEQNNILIENQEIDGLGKSEALKFSNCTDVIVKNCKIWGGIEDCVDMVRGENFYFENCDFYIRGHFAFTFKGGAKNLYIKDCRFWGEPDEVAIDCGNWSKYNVEKLPKTSNITIENCYFDIGNKNIARQMYASDIKIIIPPGRFKKQLYKMPSIFVSIFFWIRKHGWFGPKN